MKLNIKQVRDGIETKYKVSDDCTMLHITRVIDGRVYMMDIKLVGTIGDLATKVNKSNLLTNDIFKGSAVFVTNIE